MSADGTRMAGVTLDGRRMWLFDDVESSSMPAISADGKKVALWSHAQLVVYDVPSGQTHKLGLNGEHPAWAPSSDRFAYDDGENVHIYDLKHNTTTKRGPGTEPSWSFDGRTLAVRIDSSTVESIDLSSGQRRELFAGSSYPSVPRWSPDGKWITYTRRGGRSWWSIDWSGSEPRQVMLRRLKDGTETAVAEIYKANPGDFTWVTNADLCAIKR